jgi:hypothetical protein
VHKLNRSLTAGLLIICLGLCCVAWSTGQITIRKPNLPKTLRIEETGDTLTLRGVATHKNYFQDRYIAAFYSNSSLRHPVDAMKDQHAKRMWMFFLEPIPDFKSLIQESLTENNSPKILDLEQVSISQFLNMIDVPLKPGDIVVFDYLPKVGTKVMINGSVRGIIKGNEFYPYVLRIWMGRQPPSKKFRQDLFNLSS